MPSKHLLSIQLLPMTSLNSALHVRIDRAQDLSASAYMSHTDRRPNRLVLLLFHTSQRFHEALLIVPPSERPDSPVVRWNTTLAHAR